MTLANIETGEIVVPLNRDEAMNLTARIKGYVSQAWRLLAEAHERHAHLALGYSTWEEYVRAEFDLSRSQSYRLLDQAVVISAIEDAIGEDVSRARDIAHVVPGRAAEDIKPRLTDVTNAIRERITSEATAPEPDRVEAIVAEVVAKERAKAQQKAEDVAALTDLAASAERAGWDMDEDRMRQRGEFSRLCRDLAKLPSPPAFFHRQAAHLTADHIHQAEQAHAWLGEFLTTARPST